MAADEVDLRVGRALHADGGKIERQTYAHAALVARTRHDEVLAQGDVLRHDLVDWNEPRLEQVDADEDLGMTREERHHDHGNVPMKADFLARAAHFLLEPHVVTSDHAVGAHFQFRQFYVQHDAERILMHSSTPTAMISKLFGIHSSRLKGGSHSPIFHVPVQMFSD